MVDLGKISLKDLTGEEQQKALETAFSKLGDDMAKFGVAGLQQYQAVGEPPTRRGYPPSFFSLLPRLLERAGPGPVGSITALYTVLTEGDASMDPVAEEARSILDGHIVLSAELAQRNHFPAVDVLRSRSRLMQPRRRSRISRSTATSSSAS